MFIRALPFLFAFLWSTGFIGAKYGLPYIEAFTFLAVRMVLAVLLIGLIILIVRPPFPEEKQRYIHLMIAGLLIHAFYLGGVFSAISFGLAAGATAVIVGMQPLLTVFLVQGFSSLKLLFVTLIGFIGLLLVLFKGGDPTAKAMLENSNELYAYLSALVALIGITFGTLYQKKHCSQVNTITSAFVQYIPTCVIFCIIALSIEAEQIPLIDWNVHLFFAIFWLVVVLSIGAVMLMNLLYQHNSASSAASYFYLSPAIALIISYFMFDEVLNIINIVGMVLIVVSLYFTAVLQKRAAA